MLQADVIDRATKRVVNLAGQPEVFPAPDVVIPKNVTDTLEMCNSGNANGKRDEICSVSKQYGWANRACETGAPVRLVCEDIQTPSKEFRNDILSAKNNYERVQVLETSKVQSTVDRLNITTINGINAAYMCEFRGRIIYMIGETHDFKQMCGICSKGCATAEDLVVALTKGSFFPVDIYVEDSLIDASRNTGNSPKSVQSPMSEFKEKYKQCLQPDKSMCSFGMGRLHYVDARHIRQDEQSKVEYLIARVIWSSNPSKMKIVNERLVKIGGTRGLRQALSKVLEQLFGMDSLVNAHEFNRIMQSTDYVTVMNSAPFQTPPFFKIARQVMHVPSDIKELMLRFFFSHYVSKIENNGTYLNLPQSLGAMWMDIYTLGRIFRAFKTGHSESMVSLIWAGDAHCRHYLEFFRYVEDQGADDVSIIYQPSRLISKNYIPEKCMNVEAIPFFVFSDPRNILNEEEESDEEKESDEDEKTASISSLRNTSQFNALAGDPFGKFDQGLFDTTASRSHLNEANKSIDELEEKDSKDEEADDSDPFAEGQNVRQGFISRSSGAQQSSSRKRIRK
jgi:hypothetical protein